MLNQITTKLKTYEGNPPVEDLRKAAVLIAIVDCEIKKKSFKAGDTVNVQVPRWMVLQNLVLPEDKAKKLEEE